jgi:mono/diheme cytochrome c family protein
MRDYHALTKDDGAPFVPYAIWKDLFFAGCAAGRRRMRVYLRSVRSDGQAGSDDHPDRAEARLLLPVALCAALAAAAVARDAGLLIGPVVASSRCSSCHFSRERGEELAARPIAV